MAAWIQSSDCYLECFDCVSQICEFIQQKSGTQWPARLDLGTESEHSHV